MKELSLHVLDIATNAVQAKAKNISIIIEEDESKDLLSISVTDDGEGMVESMLAEAANPFITTRKTRCVGMGLPLLKQAAIECNGEVQIESEINKGTTIVAYFQHSHINRAPIGNMVDTIIVILLESSHYDLLYSHKVNQYQMVFDTREIRLKVGDVPLHEPAVIEWIRQSLQAELTKLYQYNKG